MTVKHVLSILKSPRLRHVALGNILIARIDTNNYGHYFYELSYSIYLAEKHKSKLVLISKNSRSIIKDDQIAKHYSRYVNNNSLTNFIAWSIFHTLELLFKIFGITYYFINSYLWRILAKIGLRTFSKKLSIKIAISFEKFLIHFQSIFNKNYLTDFKFFRRAYTIELKQIIRNSYFRRDLLQDVGYNIKKLLQIHENNNKKDYFVFHYRKDKVGDCNISKRDETIRSVDPNTYVDMLNYLCNSFEFGYIIGKPDDFNFIENLSSKLRFFNNKEFGNLDQIYLLANAKLFVGCESGPYHVAQILGLDTIVTNATDPVCSFPIKEGSICLMKRVRHDEGEMFLERKDLIQNLCSQKYYDSIRKNRSLYIMNSNIELLYAANLYLNQNFPDLLHENAKIVSIFAHESNEPMVKKWGNEDGKIGKGLIL